MPALPQLPLLAQWPLRHVRRLQLSAVVAAMDRAVFARCGTALRVHCLAMIDEEAEAAMAAEAVKHGAKDAASVNIRGNPVLFISLGARKVTAIVTLLHTSGRSARPTPWPAWGSPPAMS